MAAVGHLEFSKFIRLWSSLSKVVKLCYSVETLIVDNSR